MYPSCKVLRQDYPGGVPQDNPSYSAKLDRDKDEKACEQKGN
ncbi:excalibur calcium-binding domain-containing protein [Staphylococcus simulans]